jgi:hypothetical protein
VWLLAGQLQPYAAAPALLLTLVDKRISPIFRVSSKPPYGATLGETNNAAFSSTISKTIEPANNETLRTALDCAKRATILFAIPATHELAQQTTHGTTLQPPHASAFE